MPNVKCKSLLKTCRKCGWKVTGTRVESCESCSESMRCTNWAVSGYTLCTGHGGPVPSRGFYGKGTIKNGSGDSFPMMRLAYEYMKMRNNGPLLSNRAAVEVIDVRIRQLAERLDQNESPERVKTLYNLWQKYAEAVHNKDEINSVLLHVALTEEFKKTYHDYMAWNQMFEALDYRRKMSESEVKILKEIKAVITFEDMYQFQAKLLAAVMRVLGEDSQKLKQVKYEFAKIAGESSDLAGDADDEDDWRGGEPDRSEEGSGDVDETPLLHSGDEA